MTPEQQALLFCARVDLDDGARGDLAALLRGGIDFAALGSEARRHGMGALLWRRLSDVAESGCPPETLAALRAEAQESAVAGLALAGELVALLAGLREAGVTALAIKGPVSALLAYGDLGLRRFSDLDLLVAPEDVAAAASHLEGRGYVPRYGLSPAWRARLVHTDSELTFEHADRGTLVDLHWSLLPRGYSFTPGPDDVFSRQRTMRIGAGEVRTLALEPTLLFLLLHGIKHGWQRLGWLCDVAQIIGRHAELDWAIVAAWSSVAGRRRLIDVGLTLAHDLLRAPVPRDLLVRGGADPAVGRIAQSLARRLFAAPPADRRAPRAIFSDPYLMAMQRTSDRLRFLHDVVLRPTPLEWQALPLPVPLAPIHYVFRPLRLLWKHGRPRRRDLPDAGVWI